MKERYEYEPCWLIRYPNGFIPSPRFERQADALTYALTSPFEGYNEFEIVCIYRKVIAP